MVRRGWLESSAHSPQPGPDHLQHACRVVGRTRGPRSCRSGHRAQPTLADAGLGWRSIDAVRHLSCRRGNLVRFAIAWPAHRRRHPPRDRARHPQHRAGAARGARRRTPAVDVRAARRRAGHDGLRFQRGHGSRRRSAGDGRSGRQVGCCVLAVNELDSPGLLDLLQDTPRARFDVFGLSMGNHDATDLCAPLRRVG